MAAIRIDGLIFDEYNVKEIGAHKVSEREVEQVFFEGFELLKNANKHLAEYLMVGQTSGGRWLTVPIKKTPHPGIWRPATAYPTKPGERSKLKGSRK